ncbi:hypothetical protein B4123_2108 [Bacillus paralicheniformis]|nr:hypothetical protein B4123_2108 [Bacillus paralicheniformis]GIN75991.1 hypothetical protein J41TS8_10320 [Bacillus sp. J41TS8]
MLAYSEHRYWIQFQMADEKMGMKTGLQDIDHKTSPITPFYLTIYNKELYSTILDWKFVYT